MARFDIHFQLLDPADQQISRSNFTFGFGRPKAFSGPQKLINRWLKLFFTPKGSNPLHRKEGTQFPFLIGGNVTEASDAEMEIQLAIEDCNDQIRAIDDRSPWLTSDEKLGDAQILQFDTIRVDAVEFWVQITTVSGRRVSTLVPYARLSDG